MGTAKPTKTNDELKTMLLDLVKHSRTVVLLTHGEDNAICGRPMANVRTTDDVEVYLTTAIDSHKVVELAHSEDVTIAVQTGAGIAMLRGHARVSQDPKLIAELWEDSWKAWYPGGKSDPQIAIVVVEPREATFWQTDLAHGASYIWRQLKARVLGAEVEARPGDEEHVTFGAPTKAYPRA